MSNTPTIDKEVIRAGNEMTRRLALTFNKLVQEYNEAKKNERTQERTIRKND